MLYQQSISPQYLYTGTVVFRILWDFTATRMYRTTRILALTKGERGKKRERERGREGERE